jgi:hypothetical protein
MIKKIRKNEKIIEKITQNTIDFAKLKFNNLRIPF